MGNVVIIKAKIRTEAPLSIKMPVAEGARENEFENFPVMTRGVDAEGQTVKNRLLASHDLKRPFKTLDHYSEYAKGGGRR